MCVYISMYVCMCTYMYVHIFKIKMTLSDLIWT